MSVEALVRHVLTLRHDLYNEPNSRLKKIDKEIQEIVKIYELLCPESKKLSEFCQNVHIGKALSEELADQERILRAHQAISEVLPQSLQTKLIAFENMVVKTISTNIPESNLKERIFRANQVMIRLQDKEYDVVRNMVYHGDVEDINDPIFSQFIYNIPAYQTLKKALMLREEMLEKMQSGSLTPAGSSQPIKAFLLSMSQSQRKAYKDLSQPERKFLAKLCHETYNFRETFCSGMESGDKELDERIKLHHVFIDACLKGNFEAAEKLLSQGIDINANLVPMPERETTKGSSYCPLLNFACMTGKVNLVRFLLKHNAKFDIGDETDETDGNAPQPQWLPPLLECAISPKPIPNKEEIMNLLFEAGADPNQKNGHWYWAGSEHMHYGLFDHANNKAILIDLLKYGININGVDGVDFEDSPTWLDRIGLRLREISDNEKFHKVYVEYGKMLIYHGAVFDKQKLQKLEPFFFEGPDSDGLKKVAPLAVAKEVYDQALQMWRKMKFETIDGALQMLPPVLNRMINSFQDEANLSLTERLEVAAICYDLEKAKNASPGPAQGP